ncbi:MAG: hypothetical protein Q9218_001330 [Villophora microphyllina]
MTTPRYKLHFTVPTPFLEVCKQAVFSAGAGTTPDGKYSQVCFETQGTGQFMPGPSAKPALGEVDKIEKIEEVKIELLCVGKDVMLAAVDKLKNAHPYEEVAYEVYLIENV